MVKKSVNKDCGTVATIKKNFLCSAQFIGMVDTKILYRPWYLTYKTYKNLQNNLQNNLQKLAESFTIHTRYTYQSRQSEPKYLHVLLAKQVVRMI